MYRESGLRCKGAADSVVVATGPRGGLVIVGSVPTPWFLATVPVQVAEGLRPSPVTRRCALRPMGHGSGGASSRPPAIARTVLRTPQPVWCSTGRMTRSAAPDRCCGATTLA